MLAARLAPGGTFPARLRPLAPAAARALARSVVRDASVAALAAFARARAGLPAVAAGLRVELALTTFDAVYLHYGGGTRVVAVAGIGAVAVVAGAELYRTRHDVPVLHRAGSERVRDAACHECATWSELAVLWSIRAARDATAGAVAAALAFAAARHCVARALR